MGTRYVIAFNDLQKPGYLNFGILPNVFTADLKEAELLMAHRAEELVDELVTVDIDANRDPGNYAIHYDEDRLSVAVVDVDGGIFNQRVVHTILTIQTVAV